MALYFVLCFVFNPMRNECNIRRYLNEIVKLNVNCFINFPFFIPTNEGISIALGDRDPVFTVVSEICAVVYGILIKAVIIGSLILNITAVGVKGYGEGCLLTDGNKVGNYDPVDISIRLYNLLK